MTKANDDSTVFFAQDGLVDSVAAVEMWKHVTHLEM
jgi:hypothetical protein